ncbi:hypothetical protein [Azospirillum sp.]|uniref:hypothetical protein n=1 Tax=Azospirillum sp. TaxID=34012 RepID=UPI002D491E7C|nr:hypothetical protein [Azospirillum sp.]HYF88061.1 hypothetical protein [Azospirillum sp.]
MTGTRPQVRLREERAAVWVCCRPRYTGPSLRAGLAIAAAEAKAQFHDVMRQTRHTSVEVARRYMCSADLWRNNVTEKVLRSRG